MQYNGYQEFFQAHPVTLYSHIIWGYYCYTRPCSTVFANEMTCVTNETTDQTSQQKLGQPNTLKSSLKREFVCKRNPHSRVATNRVIGSFEMFTN